jgi:hypothetical protein
MSRMKEYQIETEDTRDRLVGACKALSDELAAYHDREWDRGMEGVPDHQIGECDECGACVAYRQAQAAIASAESSNTKGDRRCESQDN